MLSRGSLGSYRVAICATIALAFTLSWTATDSPPAPADAEASAGAIALLKTINTSSEQMLLQAPGLNAGVVARIMAHRKSKGSFKNLIEFRRVTRISSLDLEKALKPYQEEEDPGLVTSRRAVPDGAPQAAQTPDNTGPIGNVRPGYYAKLPGFDDLDKIDPLQRTEFLETVNREKCACGCQNETIAFCLVNDPGCPTVKARARKIYDDIVNKPPR